MAWRLEWCAWGADAPRDCGECEAVSADVHATATNPLTNEKRYCPLCSACLAVAQTKTDPPRRPTVPPSHEQNP
jgi:hypothetical protein